MKTVINESNDMLRDCANYLILLFYKTNKRYSCTRTKIGKLLSILAFKYARINHRVFWDKIYKYPGCGTYIENLEGICQRDVYFQLYYEDDNKEIPLEEIDKNIIAPMEDKDFTCISSWVRMDIEDVFHKFGAYSQERLGECLNPIVEYEGICESDGSINLNKIAELKSGDINKMSSNEAMDYIFSW